jgi:hypothetical protein
MQKKFNWGAGLLLFALAASCWIGGPFHYATSSQPILAGFSLVTGGVLLFVLIILAPIERMTKGLFLIQLAIITAVLNSLMVEPLLALLKMENGKYIAETGQHIANHESLTLQYGDWLWANLQMTSAEFFEVSTGLINAMLAFINMACAGAGGSIIAVEGDRTSIVRPVGIWKAKKSKVSEPEPVAPAALDTSPLIYALSGKMDLQTETVSNLAQQISYLDKQIANFAEQQTRMGWIRLLIAVVVTAVVSFAISAAVFARS